MEACPQLDIVVAIDLKEGVGEQVQSIRLANRVGEGRCNTKSVNVRTVRAEALAVACCFVFFLWVGR